MQLNHVFWRYSRGLVQIIDILRDHGRDLACPIEVRQGPVATTWFCVCEFLFHGEAAPP
jgi:hypothetical protein